MFIWVLDIKILVEIVIPLQYEYAIRIGAFYSVFRVVTYHR